MKRDHRKEMRGVTLEYSDALGFVKTCKDCAESKPLASYSIYCCNGLSRRRHYCTACEYKKRDRYKDKPYYNQYRYNSRYKEIVLARRKERYLNDADYQARVRERAIADYKKNRTRRIESAKVIAKKISEALTDRYVLAAISKHSPFTTKEAEQIPHIDKLIEIKRLQIKIHRSIKTKEYALKN